VLILRKIIKIVATRYQTLRLKCTKFDFVYMWRNKKYKFSYLFSRNLLNSFRKPSGVTIIFGPTAQTFATGPIPSLGNRVNSGQFGPPGTAGAADGYWLVTPLRKPIRKTPSKFHSTLSEQ